MKKAATFLAEVTQYIDPTEYHDAVKTMDFLQRTAKRFEEKFPSIDQQLSTLRQNLDTCYNDLNKVEYRLHAVFSHRGQANDGHYWIYIYDWENERWLKYNDEMVTVVDEKEVFSDTTGKDENPYCLVYVDAQRVHQLVRTVNRGATVPREGQLA
jgi:ubiquitin carboxyl-terminal hydrolase 25/28